MRTTRPLLLVSLALILVLALSTVLYDLGMTHLEGKPRTMLESMAWATETLSTTGYGADSKWSHPAMILLVAAVQFVGVISVPLLVALLLVPYLSSQFERRLPRAAPDGISGHVLVYQFSPVVETLLQKLQEKHIPSLVVEVDEERARAVMDSGQSIVFTRAEEDALEAGHVEVARALVANGSDQENAAMVLRARQMGFGGEIYSFVENPAHRKAMELAGATAVFTPRHIVAAALAAHASDTLSPRLPGLEQVSGIVRREVRVPLTSPSAGKRAGDVGVPAVIAGQWHRSHLETHCSAAMVIEPGALLELVGEEAAIAESARILGGTVLRHSGYFLIAGYGEVGQKVRELLTDVGEEVRVVERHASPDVDVVGDVLDSSVLHRAGIEGCRSVILALDSDDATLFAAVIARDAAPDVPVIARVNHARNLDNIHRAGADYALSISDISGQMLYSKLLGRSIRARDEHRRVVRSDARRFAGVRVGDVHARHDLSVIAIERSGSVRSPAADETIGAEDRLWLCGTVSSLRAMTT